MKNLDLLNSYLAAGLWIVPLVYNSKVPMGSAAGWQKKRLPDSTVIMGVSGGVGGNIGCVCGKGSNIICIDIDVKRNGLDWYNKNKDILSGAIVEETPGGGLHLLFTYNENVASSRDLIAPGVEILNDGRYFVTSPSIIDGKEYKIQQNKTLLDICNPIPQELLSIIIDAKRPEVIKDIIPLQEMKFLNDPFDLKFAKSDLKTLGQAHQGQMGDTHTFKAALIGLKYSISPENWFKELCIWDEKNEPAWGHHGLWEKICNAYKYAKEMPGQKSVSTDFSAVGAEVDIATIDPKATFESVKATEKVVAQSQDLKYPYKNPINCANVLLADDFKESLIFWQEEFYIYKDNSWYKTTQEQMISIVSQIIESAQKCNLKSTHTKEIILSLRNKCIQNSPATIDIRLDGANGDWLRFKNGLLNLNSKNLETHSPLWFSTTTVPFDYNPTAECPTWHSFLQSLWPDDPTTYQALQSWLGYCISSATRFQKAALFIGESRAGKGIITRILEKLVGFNNCTATTLTAISSNFGLSPIVGKKILFLHDIHKGHGGTADMALEKLKSLIGHDAQLIDRKFQGLMYERLKAKMLLVANAMPNFIDSRSGFINRLVVFNFKKSFMGKEDWSLEDKLEFEIPGIFNWALEGISLWREKGDLLYPTTHKDTLEDLERSLNPLKSFLLDSIDYQEGGYISREQLYGAYENWCQENGRKPKSADVFIGEISSMIGAVIPGTEYSRFRADGARVRGVRNGTIKRNLGTTDFY